MFAELISQNEAALLIKAISESLVSLATEA
jgi:hypothetical protein